jgi:hypothetical protein
MLLFRTGLGDDMNRNACCLCPLNDAGTGFIANYARDMQSISIVLRSVINQVLGIGTIA